MMMAMLIAVHAQNRKEKKMAKRVRYFTDYIIEDATSDEDALEQANAKLEEDIEKGWFSLDYEVMDEE
jgi:KaiC/GvpD/RAD55 family RecA-like ATPase